jgi:NAD(P)H-dependent flavin oxidoreductase YrpB (nitropropane dioxygenase family)
MTRKIKDDVISKWGIAKNNSEKIFTDPLASPTGFPFKVAPMKDTLSDETQYLDRKRICDIGYLREMVMQEDGVIVYRCPAEPVNDFVKKGGDEKSTIGRKCLCNALMSSAGVAQIQKDDYIEQVLITAGDDVVNLYQYTKPNQTNYSATDVINYLLQ